MEIVFTRAENACGYERPLDERLHTVEHRGGEKKKEKEGRRRKRGGEKGKVRVLHFLSNGNCPICKSSVWLTGW